MTTNPWLVPVTTLRRQHGCPPRGAARRPGGRAVGRRQRGAGVRRGDRRHPARFDLRRDRGDGLDHAPPGRASAGAVFVPWTESCIARCESCTGREPTTRRRTPTRTRTRSQGTIWTSARWCATPCCSSCRWRRCARRTAAGCARRAARTSTRGRAAALRRPWTRAGRPSTRSGPWGRGTLLIAAALADIQCRESCPFMID